jgi:hypothetical protein
VSQPAAGRIAWGLWALAMALVGLFYWLALANRAADQTQPAGDLFALVEVVYTSVGAFLASRRPRNPLGWLFLGIGLLQTVNVTAGAYARYGLVTHPGSLPGAAFASWVEAWSWIPGFITIAFVLLLFPTGTLLSRRWRPAVFGAAAGIAMATLAGAVETWSERGLALVAETDEAISAVGAVFFAAGFVLGGIATLAGLASVFVRFRRSRGDERQQLKWFLSAGAFALACSISAFVGTWTPDWLLDVALAGIAIAVAIAVLKYRLYDIDLIVRRTLVYGVLSAGLVGLYFAIVLLLQQAFSSFAGGSDLAIAGSTLAVAALFRPIRNRIQTLVDRRFYRRKYDTQHTLEAFSGRLREQVDLEALSAELQRVVGETMQPASVSLWLRAKESGR